MSIPTLDLAGERGEAAKQLVAALEDPGFLYIKNVQGYDPDELLRHTEWFFSLPLDVRMSLARREWNPKNSNRYRGYCPVIPGVADYKEHVDFSHDLSPSDPLSTDEPFYEPNVWVPDSVSGASDFKGFILSYHRCMSDLVFKVSHLLALGLEKEENYFDNLFEKPLSTLRLIHYPLREGTIPESAIKDGHILTFKEHTDTNFVTFICTFGYRGLQILEGGGSWSDVEVIPDCLLMNAGDALVKTTGRFKATRHRVVDYGMERFSVPFFAEPGYYADITRYGAPISEEAIALCSTDLPNQYGPWLQERIKKKKFSDYPAFNHTD
ncbi:Isopenicillin N synthase [Geodia barretti]|uniref:Isopenicillin N synthase n=2 Tax=Geodia barretti TaxID=519541 RepID=A0AA35R7Z1_GEOBA|nr:Isopenicillin N synthase [Geodia barretti]